MKKILGLVAALMITAFTFAQSTATFKDATPGYDKMATSKFNFTFGDVLTPEEIMSNAAYYDSYFTVAVTPGGDGVNNVTITLVEDNEMSRRVMLRLLVNLDVKNVSVNGTDMERNDFMIKYIMVD
jgi:hypothetical protein